MLNTGILHKKLFCDSGHVIFLWNFNSMQWSWVWRLMSVLNSIYLFNDFLYGTINRTSLSQTLWRVYECTSDGVAFGLFLYVILTYSGFFLLSLQHQHWRGSKERKGKEGRKENWYFPALSWMVAILSKLWLIMHQALKIFLSSEHQYLSHLSRNGNPNHYNLALAFLPPWL